MYKFWLFCCVCWSWKWACFTGFTVSSYMYRYQLDSIYFYVSHKFFTPSRRGRFLVIDTHQLILVEPDNAPTRLGILSLSFFFFLSLSLYLSIYLLLLSQYSLSALYQDMELYSLWHRFSFVDTKPDKDNNRNLLITVEKNHANPKPLKARLDFVLFVNSKLFLN